MSRRASPDPVLSTTISSCGTATRSPMATAPCAAQCGSMRDYRSLLAGEKCWDADTEALFEEHGEPLEDAVLQNREELIALCELMEEKGIQSYLEIGVWTGALVRALARLFPLDPLAACDDGYAERFGLELSLPGGTR